MVNVVQSSYINVYHRRIFNRFFKGQYFIIKYCFYMSHKVESAHDMNAYNSGSSFKATFSLNNKIPCCLAKVA